MAPLIRACLAATADESGHLIVVSDANGVLLWVEGNAQVRMRAADSMNFAEGTLWSEGGAGTNAIGTALAAEHAVQVFAAEHFNEGVQKWTCAAAPVHDPDTGKVIGVIDLTGEMATVHPHSMAVATATAQAVEAHLRCEMLNRDARLLSRYGDQLTGSAGPRALVAPVGSRDRQSAAGLAADRPASRCRPAGACCRSARPTRPWPRRSATTTPISCAPPWRRRGPVRRPPRARPLALSLLGRDGAEAEVGGEVVPLRLRHAEILTLLCANPEGLTSEELSDGVYGDPLARRLDPSRDLPAAQAAGRLHRDRALPAAARRRLPTWRRSADCCTAVRCARPPLGIRDRCCPARPRPGSSTNARRSRAGCANR